VTLTANPATASGAVTGGAKQRIFLSPPDVTEAEELAVVRAIRSGWVAPAGPDLTAFEAEVAARVGVAHGVGLSSATAALHLGLLTLGVGPGDVVITSTMTFAATANAITYVGAEPYFIDALPGTGNLDPQLVAQALDELTAAGERVAGVGPGAPLRQTRR
jgi:dTDP-4-amino-4,6-dideoxygalactose transaminase